MNLHTTLEPTSTPDEQGSAAPADRGVWWQPLAWLALLLLLGISMPFVPVPNRAVAALGALLLTVVYVVAVVQFIVSATRLRSSIAILVGTLVLAGGMWFLFDTTIVPQMADALRAARRATNGNPASGLIFLRNTARTLTDLLLLCAAFAGGSLVSKLITAPNMLAPICAVIMMIDVWGVLFGGIVAQLVEKAPTVAGKAMTSMPTVGAATASRFVIEQPSIGVGDFLFLAVLFAALHTHRMNWRGAAKWVTPLIILALLGITFGIPALPGLVFIGLGVAIPNLKFFQFTRDEKFALLWAGVFVAFLTVALYFAAPYIVQAAQNLEPK
jgi:hypothetical protein